MSFGKVLNAVCPLCQIAIPLGNGHDVMACDALISQHLEKHTLAEWVCCVQNLRASHEERDQLRRIPYWAMPRA